LVTGSDRNLPKVLQAAISAVGVLVVRVANPKAAIYLNGKIVGTHRVEIVVVPGRWVVEIRLGGRTVARRDMEVDAGREMRWENVLLARRAVTRPVRRISTVPLKKTSTRSATRRGVHWAYFTSAVVVALGAAVGAGTLFMMTKRAHEDFLADRTDASLREEGILYQTTGGVLWGVAAAAATTAVVLAIFTRWRGGRKERPSALRVTPTLTPDGAGAGLTLTWTH